MKIGQLGNIEIKDGSALVSINPEIYTISSIFNAAYCLCDEAFIVIDGNPSEEMLVEIKNKKGGDVLPLVYKFNEELINHIVYEERDSQTRPVKKMLMQKILIPPKFEEYIDKAIIEKITRKEAEKGDKFDDLEIE